jgi:acetyl/propionyl-CoA carboxylase alpha subunit
MTWKLSLDGDSHELAFTKRTYPQEVTIDGRAMPVTAYVTANHGFLADVDGQVGPGKAVRDGNRIFVHHAGEVWTVEIDDPLLTGASGAGGISGDSMTAPMPGTMLNINVEPGAAVREGDVLVVIESMKLETTVKAWRDGTIADIHIAEGATFDRGDALVSLEPEAD